MVAVAGCKDNKEISISIASSNIQGGLVDLSVVDGVTVTVGEERSTQIPRFKRDGSLVISEKDFLIPPPASIQAAVQKPSASSPLPVDVVLETSIRYDNSLLETFGGSHTATKLWISKVIELSRPRLSLLQVKVQIRVVGDMKHHNGVIKADETTIHGLQSKIAPKSLLSFFSADICTGSCVVGIAFVGTACRNDGYAININEYYTDTNSEIKTARTFVHELGHNMGMW